MTEGPARTRLPDAVTNVAYRQRLKVKGGAGTYAWALSSGSDSLPPGVALTRNGDIAGTPSQAGSWEFTVEVVSGGEVARLSLAVDVHPRLEPVNMNLPEAAESAAYAHKLEARGGDGSYRWALAPASAPLPQGLSLSRGGRVMGVPTIAGTSSFEVEVSSGRQRARLRLSVTVQAALTVRGATLRDAVERVPYALELEATGGDGTYIWALAAGSGRLPPGLRLSREGAIRGTPRAPGMSSFTVEVTCGRERARKRLSLTVKQAKVRTQRRQRPGLPPSVRRAATAVLSLGLAAGAGLASTRWLFVEGGPPAWYEALAGARASVYAELYPTLELMLGLLVPVVVVAAFIHALFTRVAPNIAGVESAQAVVSPSKIRTQAKIDRGRPRSVERFPRAKLRATIAALLGTTSILHLLALLLARPDDRIGLILGLAACALALLVWWSDLIWLSWVLGLFAAAQAATFVSLLIEAPAPFDYRPLLALTVSLYLALPVLLIGTALPRSMAGAVIASALALTVGALSVETAASVIVWRQGGIPVAPPPIAAPDPDYDVRDRGPREEHPDMGFIPVPNSVTETLYPDDPRGYFQMRHASSWALSHQPSSAARLERTREGIAVVIDRADEPTPAHVFLARYGIELVEGTDYRVRFRVRATRERPYSFAVSMAHPPGEGLGLVGTDTARTEWTSVTRIFTSRSSEDSARVDLRLGGDTADVYVADLSVTRMEDGTRVDGGPDIEHYVPYEWNSRGCRTREHAIPPTPQTFRVLVLGDGSTAGFGVHSSDVFTTVMQRHLQETADRTGDGRQFEIVNCGVNGFSTREERLYYVARARAYQPDLVLVVMVADDNRSPLDSRLIPTDAPARWEYLLHAAYLAQSRRRAARTSNFSAAMSDLAELHRLVNEDGAGLAVVVFTINEDPAWEGLSEAATSTARALGFPVLDLGHRLVRDGSSELTVHPLDARPNEIAHRIAGEAIAAWVEQEGLTAASHENR